ncbi:nascent polypeptide-associated complex protein [Candidatus Micrarchaeota archaeon]|nr:nascent polypeptide-associated complex protein [Candidatus Micrarchaeota archaeon]
MMPGGFDPKKMGQLMKQMGIKSEDIAAKKVTIETDSGSYVVENPQVVEITVQGEKSYQVSGKVRFEEGIGQEDVKMVMDQAGCSEEEAAEALRKTKGDIAEAIVLLEKAKE